MDKFKEYLEKNLMDFAPISDYVVEIGGKTFELYQPAYDGALFDDGFNFVGIPADPKRKGSGEESVETSCDSTHLVLEECIICSPKVKRMT